MTVSMCRSYAYRALVGFCKAFLGTVESLQLEHYNNGKADTRMKDARVGFEFHSNIVNE